MLSRLGYHVLAARLPSEALTLSEKHSGPIHLILTDVIMPEMNGKALAEKIASSRPGIKCLFTSGYTGDIITHHGMLDKHVHFIQKPFTKQSLAVKIREALDDPS